MKSHIFLKILLLFSLIFHNKTILIKEIKKRKKSKAKKGVKRWVDFLDYLITKKMGKKGTRFFLFLYIKKVYKITV